MAANSLTLLPSRDGPCVPLFDFGQVCDYFDQKEVIVRNPKMNKEESAWPFMIRFYFQKEPQ